MSRLRLFPVARAAVWSLPTRVRRFSCTPRMAVGPPGYQWAQEGAGVTSGEIEVLRKQVDSLRAELENVRMQANTAERQSKEGVVAHEKIKKESKDAFCICAWVILAGLTFPAVIIGSV